MSATPRESVPVPLDARACVFEVDSGDEPEHALVFRSGTVPFTLQCWTESALAHYSGTAVYETTSYCHEPHAGRACDWTSARSGWPPKFG